MSTITLTPDIVRGELAKRNVRPNSIEDNDGEIVVWHGDGRPVHDLDSLRSLAEELGGEQPRHAAIPEDAEMITGIEADDLYRIAVEGQDADGIQLVGVWRSPDGRTWTQTIGLHGDGQDCTGVHVRDADGEFIELVREA